MALPMPNLDDRRWADLVEEGRALLPVYAPDWTDHNDSDPGITFIELLAWIAEMDVYRVNLIPERHRRKFLALAGIRLRPPAPARTVLGLGFDATKVGSQPFRLPAGTEFAGTDVFGVRTLFRAKHAVTVAPARLESIQREIEGRFHDVTGLPAAGEPLRPFGDDPRPGAALYLGFDVAFPRDEPVSLYFLGADAAVSATERRSLIREWSANHEGCDELSGTMGCVRVPAGNATASALPCADTQIVLPGAMASRPATTSSRRIDKAAALRHHSVRTVWEIAVAPGVWRTLDPDRGEVRDGTRAFTLDGRVVLRAPAAMIGQAMGSVRANRYYVRCRLAAGQYDAAPAIHHVIVNGVRVEQAVESGGEGIAAGGAIGTGEPFQRIALPEKPVIASSVRLFTEPGPDGTWALWERRDDLDASSPTDRHFVLDATAGEITVGDGAHGSTVGEGSEIQVDYRVTRAEAGNVPAGTIRALAGKDRFRHWEALVAAVEDRVAEMERSTPGLSVGAADALSWIDALVVSQPFPAAEGAAAETLAHAEGRAIERMEERTRAVTLEDFEQVALHTPGVRLARAHACANVHPRLPCYRAPGIVTVVVIPHLPQARPMPSAELRRTVASYLARRRLIGSRIEVVGPTYHVVTVRAKVQLLSGVGPGGARERIAASLERFFHPLKGGTDQEGWPLGRDVYRSEVLQVIDETAGVDFVVDLELVDEDGLASCANLCIGPFGLVASGRHAIEVRQP